MPSINVEDHQRLAYVTYMHYRKCYGARLTQDEGIQEAMIGFWRAAKSYEKDLSAWSTYATYWARSRIQQAIFYPYRMPSMLRSADEPRGKFNRRHFTECATDEIHVQPCDRQQRERQAEENREAIALAMESLPQREQVILRLHFFEDMSLADVAKEMGITRQRIHQILERVFDKLRARMERAA